MEDEEERLEFLKDLGLPEAGLPQIIRESYKLLGLHTFYTVGPKGKCKRLSLLLVAALESPCLVPLTAIIAGVT